MTSAESVTGYCVRCKENGRAMVGPTIETAKNGRPFWRGTCSSCGTGMTRIISKAEAAA